MCSAGPLGVEWPERLRSHCSASHTRQALAAFARWTSKRRGNAVLVRTRPSVERRETPSPKRSCLEEGRRQIPYQDLSANVNKLTLVECEPNRGKQRSNIKVPTLVRKAQRPSVILVHGNMHRYPALVRGGYHTMGELTCFVVSKGSPHQLPTETFPYGPAANATELVVMKAASIRNPRKAVPHSTASHHRSNFTLKIWENYWIAGSILLGHQSFPRQSMTAFRSTAARCLPRPDIRGALGLKKIMLIQHYVHRCPDAPPRPATWTVIGATA